MPSNGLGLVLAANCAKCSVVRCCSPLSVVMTECCALKAILRLVCGMTPSQRSFAIQVRPTIRPAATLLEEGFAPLVL